MFTELQDKHIDHSCCQTKKIFILILPNGNLLHTSIVMIIFQNPRSILQLIHRQYNTTWTSNSQINKTHTTTTHNSNTQLYHNICSVERRVTNWQNNFTILQFYQFYLSHCICVIIESFTTHFIAHLQKCLQFLS